MSDILSSLLAFAVAAGVAFGILAAFPRKRRALIPAVVVILIVFALMSALGSGLVGPFDLRSMFIFTPFTALCAGVWYFWKIKPKEVANG